MRITRGSALSSVMSAVLTRQIISSPAKRDFRWTNGPLQHRRFLRLDDHFEVRDEYQRRLHLFDLREGEFLYNQRLEQLNAHDSKGDRYTFMYGTTRLGIPMSEIVDAGIRALVALGSQRDNIAIGATINRFIVENGANPLYGDIESDSDGAPTLVSMAGLGLGQRLLYQLGNVDHEEYFNHPEHARGTASHTFRTLGFGTEPLYDPVEVEFASPADDVAMEAGPDGRIAITGKIHWTGDDRLARRVDADKTAVYYYDLRRRTGR